MSGVVGPFHSLSESDLTGVRSHVGVISLGGGQRGLGVIPICLETILTLAEGNFWIDLLGCWD